MSDDHTRADAVGALERLADQAWNTAGDVEGRERVHEDRATVLAVLDAAPAPTEDHADTAATAHKAFVAGLQAGRIAENDHWLALIDRGDFTAATHVRDPIRARRDELAGGGE